MAKLWHTVQIHTDDGGRWYAEVSHWMDGGASTEWTRTCETWEEAMRLAAERIADKRRRG